MVFRDTRAREYPSFDLSHSCGVTSALPRRLIFVRHAESAANAADTRHEKPRYSHCHVDHLIPITELGVEQIKQTAVALGDLLQRDAAGSGLQIAAVVSPFLRTRMTHAVLASVCEIAVADGCLVMDFIERWDVGLVQGEVTATGKYGPGDSALPLGTLHDAPCVGSRAHACMVGVYEGAGHLCYKTA